VTAIERNGQLLGPVEVLKPRGGVPVDIDLNEITALGAVDAKRAARTAERTDTRSVRRVRKQPGRRQHNRTPTFAQQTAVIPLCWTSPTALLVCADRRGLCPPTWASIRGKAWRQPLSLWPWRAIRTVVEHQAPRLGVPVTSVDQQTTCRLCRRCGTDGVRKRHRVSTARRRSAKHSRLFHRLMFCFLLHRPGARRPGRSETVLVRRRADLHRRHFPGNSR